MVSRGLSFCRFRTREGVNWMAATSKNLGWGIKKKKKSLLSSCVDDNHIRGYPYRVLSLWYTGGGGKKNDINDRYIRQRIAVEKRSCRLKKCRIVIRIQIRTICKERSQFTRHSPLCGALYYTIMRLSIWKYKSLDKEHRCQSLIPFNNLIGGWELDVIPKRNLRVFEIIKRVCVSRCKHSGV